MANTSLSREDSKMSLIVWLDSQINQTEENQQIQSQLRQTIDHMEIFDNINQCEQYITQTINTSIYFIINGEFDDQIISHIHKFSQILYIYIVSNDSKKDTNFPKVRKMTKDFNSIVTAIKLNYEKQQKLEEPLSISIYEYEKSSTDINGSFLHSQLLIDFLQRIEPNIKDKDELVELCKNEYKNDRSALKKIKQFQEEYEPTRAMWWYIDDTFLYRMLNKALRTFNIYQLFLFRFLIRDLRDQLIELRNNQSLSSINTVYRAQQISRIELDTLRQSVNKIISMNSFLSTSLNRDMCRFILGNCNDLYQPVLFEINIDPKLVHQAKPYAYITIEGTIPGEEEEVLFMLGSIFRIKSVSQEDDGIWIIRMSLCSDNDHDLQPLFQHLKCKIENPATSLLQFGLHLNEAAYYSEAEQFIQRVLHEFENKKDDASLYILAHCYVELGILTDEKDDLEESLKWYKKGLDILERILPPYDQNLATIYNGMGLVYHKMADFKLAFEAYTKALHIIQHLPGEMSEFVAGCLFNIGRVHAASALNHPSPVEELERALNCFHKVLDIRRKCLPEHHPELAASYEQIALVHHRFSEFDQAFEYLDKTLKLKQKSLPSHHPYLGFTYNNIGSVQYSAGNYKQALSCFEEALKIYRKQFDENHREIVKTKENVEHAIKALENKGNQ